MKNRWIVFLLVLALLLGSCGPAKEGKEKSDLPQVTVTTTFLQDMTQELAGDFVNIQLIIPAGEDPHLYTAKPADYSKIENADLLLYQGLHFEGKMVEALEARGKAVTAKFKKEDLGELDADGYVVVDPHFWFDIDLYKLATETAAEYLEELLPEHKEEISENLKTYLGKLEDLDQEVREKLNEIPKESRYLITPHDAFNYFSRAYGITVRSPQGVSTSSEVGNKDIDETVNFIVSHKIKAVFAESTTDPARMRKLQEACKSKGFDVEVVSGEGKELLSDSLAPKGEDGDTYISMYEHNINLIYEHLK